MRNTRPAALLALALLVGCGAAQEPALPGTRIAIRDEAQAANVARPISLPAARQNPTWPMRGGASDHAAGHVALSGLTPAFATPIGQGDTRRARITAEPVVAGGLVFTLDASSLVSAVSAASGGIAWQTDITPPYARSGQGSGGGLAFGDGRLFVSDGFGRVSALDAATGTVAWVQDLDAPGSAAPTYAGGRVYAMSRDGRGWALDARTGRIDWTVESVTAGANFSGGAGAAVTGDWAVFPFASGEVIGTFAEGGLRRWSAVIAGSRPGFAQGIAATDIGADPVIDGSRVYVGNASGRVVALDLDTGERLWTATQGATSPVVPAGGSVFFVNDIGQLTRADAATGTSVWQVDLPLFEEDNPRRYQTRWVHYGPVLASGRLIVASSDGVLRSFDPVSGALTGQVPLPGGAASAPVVAGGTLYVVSEDGQLLAFR
ncbi:PQQ-like beta-propeller repeat protein [Wenxinia saemankumensis]|uniref:Outer membrane protein assembly factor BamB, contains PQQ-like beta-propeller repeat n=1 Tax=Wenxinia saemankumensis TaxID=1447782 RepID=A0A1M6EPP4_9RHOB|nr:PQQ-like beta-propeller repeat protein [Wenxinia saemankumensis]SHI87376.1 Outer membrane protein assembly factor BamB, contains PQQ-like beta-propeller repeat [Wenxinia saemankumensis]